MSLAWESVLSEQKRIAAGRCAALAMTRQDPQLRLQRRRTADLQDGERADHQLLANNLDLVLSNINSLYTQTIQTIYKQGSAFGVAQIAVISTAFNDLIGKLGKYNELRRLTQGTGLEVHHLIEKRFFECAEIANLYGSRGMMPAVVLEQSTHRGITGNWRNVCPYGSNYAGMNYSEIRGYTVSVYGGGIHDDWLDFIFG